LDCIPSLESFVFLNRPAWQHEEMLQGEENMVKAMEVSSKNNRVCEFPTFFVLKRHQKRVDVSSI